MSHAKLPDVSVLALLQNLANQPPDHLCNGLKFLQKVLLIAQFLAQLPFRLITRLITMGHTATHARICARFRSSDCRQLMPVHWQQIALECLEEDPICGNNSQLAQNSENAKLLAPTKKQLHLIK
jgi:hypothetical protein